MTPVAAGPSWGSHQPGALRPVGSSRTVRGSDRPVGRRRGSWRAVSSAAVAEVGLAVVRVSMKYVAVESTREN